MIRSYVKLRLKQDATPKIIPPRRIPYSRIDLITKELQKWINDKIIEPVEDVRWANPLTPVFKSDGSLRLCADFKNTINRALEDFKYPIPRINDLIAKLSKGKKFIKIDFKSAFLQVPIHKESRDFLTISTHKGYYRFARFPFGLKTSSAIFQQTMDNIFGDMKDVIFYIDELLITGDDDEAHLNNIKMVFDKISNGLIPNFTKSIF
ncbi:unnamed protein product [Gordionus sp. m RMFG-2023]